MFNSHLTYKPPSSWRILFQYGGIPMQFSHLKKFRALVVPLGGYCKGIIIQGRQLKHIFSFVIPVMLDKKRGYNWSICTLTHTQEQSICTDVHTFYIKQQMTRKPSLANPPEYKQRPQGSSPRSCYAYSHELFLTVRDGLIILDIIPLLLLLFAENILITYAI